MRFASDGCSTSKFPSFRTKNRSYQLCFLFSRFHANFIFRKKLVSRWKTFFSQNDTYKTNIMKGGHAKRCSRFRKLFKLEILFRKALLSRKAKFRTKNIFVFFYKVPWFMFNDLKKPFDVDFTATNKIVHENFHERY